MDTEATPSREPGPLLTAAEAAILLLAVFFLVSWGLLTWWRASGGQSLPVWLAASTVPASVLLVPLLALPNPWRRKMP